ncbi:hypothetical protein DNU06_07050 [Putridiphycobacter roseus]|uniref:Uncharacterized protein n=1 Tax=Putridiphycobacter roseus TaxID=2219161 RepID=A0A2W1MZD3_9FLAO|nr:hypothetical protein [Putridiphycobacter roseus]PZE17579.1 hypothetical protein DNU06_07050 [Putridiphycobacter roseus]
MENWKKFENEDTATLIKLFQSKAEEESVREGAFYSLCYRFRKDLLCKCEITCKRFGHDINVAEQISEATFARYAQKGDFKIEKSSLTSIDAAFKLYLYAISKNELTNYYRLEEKKKRGHYYDGSERIITDLPPLPNIKLCIEDEIRLRAIESLSPAHRAVYLTYKQHERNGCNLSKQLQNELREHLGGVKQTTVRGYKKEANDKVNIYLEAMNLTKELSDEEF